MSDSNFKFDAFIQKHQIDTAELSEKVQAKIDTFDETFDLYQNAEENSKEEEDLLAKLHAYDSGILSDLESYMAQKQKDTPPAQAADGTQTAANPATPPPSSTDAPSQETPSWRFWM